MENSNENVESTSTDKTPVSPISSNDICATSATNSQKGIDTADAQSDASSSEGEEWEPSQDSVSMVKDLMDSGVGGREILTGIRPDLILPADLDESVIWGLIVNCLSEPGIIGRRNKMAQYNSFDDAVQLIKSSKNIVVLTGAGVSVSCGIPDFRSKDGIYSRLHREFPDLPDPQALFDIDYFRHNPQPFYDFAKEIYPGTFKASLSHKFIGLLEQEGLLLRNFSQNIDCLEWDAGITKLVQCHGSFQTFTCCTCGFKATCEALKETVMAKEIPRCPICPPDSSFPVLKPDIIFFGENLPESFHKTIEEDEKKVDLLVVIGSSMKVGPVNMIPNSLAPTVPQILINREDLPHLSFDVELLGNCDLIIEEICRRLGGNFDRLVRPDSVGLREISEAELNALHPAEDKSEANPPADDCSGPTPVKLAKLEETKGDGTGQKSPSTQPDQNSKELEAIRSCYQPRFQNYASQLPSDTYLFLPPNRYVFHGAEVFKDLDSESECTSSSGQSTPSHSSSSSSEEENPDKSELKPECSAEEKLPSPQ